MKLHKARRFLVLLLCTALLSGILVFPAAAAPVWPDNVNVAAEGAILMDADSGAILHGKNIHIPYYPASITKILTALIVIENCNLDDTVTFSHNAIFNVESGSSSAGLDVGDQLTVRDALYAMLLKSANEAANGLAEHAAGSIEAFAAMMNARAASLGCTSSHFNNPSGLNDPNHYTTAYDMAKIAQAAFQNDTFVEIDSTLYHDIPPTKRNPEGLRVYPGHRMLKKNTAQYYPGIVGGKTGYTSLAGNTLVTCAERDGMRLIAVVLNGHQTHYIDTKALLNFGFNNFKTIDVGTQDTAYSSIENDMTISGLPVTDMSVLHVDSDCKISLPANAEFADTTSTITYDLPENAPGDAVAQIFYEYDGRQIGSTYLLLNEKGMAATQPAVEVATTEPPAAALPDGESPEDTQASLNSGFPEDAQTSPDGGSPESMETAGRSPSGDRMSGTGRRLLPGLHIPRSFLLPLAVIIALAAVTGGLIFLKIRIEKREEAERTARYQRRQQRLRDIGISTTEFDMMLNEKRSASANKPRRKPYRRPRHRKSFLDSKSYKNNP